MNRDAVDSRRVVAFNFDNARYPEEAPFHPGETYPESRFGEVASEMNSVYDGVRECFRLYGLDKENEGTQEWNPLSDLVERGETILLKPNLVKENHPRDPDGWKYVLTHGSIVRAVADYTFKAVGSEGTVVVADAPQTDSSFREISRILCLPEIRDFYREKGLDFRLVDMRQEEWKNEGGVIVERRELEGDPEGYIEYDLGEHSEFKDHPGSGTYYGADYNSEQVNRHHSGGHHRYLLAASPIEADVVFSLPKMKTHKKAGVTLSLKNLVGINGDKNYLPHHTEAGPHGQGDEHPDPDPKHRLERGIVPYFRKLALTVPVIGPRIFQAARKVGEKIFGKTEEVIRSGNWWGNDTTWRMCLDLNKLLFYGNSDGTLRGDEPSERKRHFVLCDGVIAGEGRGPMNPDPVDAGVLVFGVHPASSDAVCTWLMGYDPEKIPIVSQSFRCESYALAEWEWKDIDVVSNRSDWNRSLPEIEDSSTFHFKPHFGWEGHILRSDSTAEEARPG